MSEKTVLEAIRKECRKHEGCHGCHLKTNIGNHMDRCLLMDCPPSNWDTSEIEKRVKEEI